LSTDVVARELDFGREPLTTAPQGFVCFLTDFDRAGEATGMPLFDPKRLSSGPPEADNAYQIVRIR
jgi:hypothetical protein